MNAQELARALGFKRSGNQWLGRCIAHDDHNPSMIVFEGRNGSTQVRCLAGCQSIEIVEALQARGLWGAEYNGDMPIDQDEERRARETPQATPNRNHDLAMRIWDEACEPAGTPVSLYLRNRHLALPASCSHVIRYHPACPNGDQTMPALVALMRNVETFEPQAINRLFLVEQDGWRKSSSMMLGPARNAAMMVTSRHDTFWDCMSYCPRLCVGEGLETTLALRQYGGPGVRAIWALGSASAVKNLPVLFGVGSLVIFADNDKAGLDAAYECCGRWYVEHAVRTSIKIPRQRGTDFCDELAHG